MCTEWYIIINVPSGTQNKPKGKMKMSTTKNELREMCENIREELTRLYEAEFTDEEREEMQENDEPTDLYEYFNDVLDSV